MRRVATAVLLAMLLLALGAAAASGHASFRERAVPADSDQTLVLRVPEERDGEGTVAVETLVPPEFEIVDCPPDDGWTCEIEEEDEGTVLSWSRDVGGAEAMLSILVRTPAAPGDYRWPTIQTYDSGTEVAWTQDAGEDRPAPVLTVAAAGAPVVEDTSHPADHGDVASTVAPTPPQASVLPTEPEETEFTPPVSPSETGEPADPTATVSPTPAAEDDDGGVALLAAAVGALRMARRGPAGGAPRGTADEPHEPGV